MANVVGVRPCLSSPLSRKIDALVKTRALACALPRPVVGPRRPTPAFNSEQHRELVLERSWRLAKAAFAKAFPHLSVGCLSMKEIVAEVAAKHGLSADDLLGPLRTVVFVRPRHEAIYRIAVERPDLSYPQIGKYFGRDHTTALHAVKQHARRNHLPPLTGRTPT